MNTNYYAFVIPAFNPDNNLLDLISNIRKKSSEHIFIIDDGSSDITKIVFTHIKNMQDPKITLLHHAINLGKGASLKTVFNHILVNHPKILGVVTLDSDGQHSVMDSLRVLSSLKDKNTSFVLGYRTFSRDIPLKSYIGNNISKFIYKIILGKTFKDTQTGLRGLSKSFMKICLSIKSNRFEFETEQLAIAVNQDIHITEIPIETIYIENNKASSFRPLIDSFRIYFILFRYGLSSIITAIIDLIIFLLALSLGSSVIQANIVARTVSIGVQFKLLDTYVFNTKSKLLNFIFFTAYVYLMGIISAITQVSVVENWNLTVVSAKILIESILFFINFAFLRLYIFTKK